MTGASSPMAPRVALVGMAGAVEREAVPRSDRLLAESLRLQGAVVHAVAWSDRRVAWHSYDAVVVRSCWDYHLHSAAFLQWLDALDAIGAMVVNPTALLRWNVDKHYLLALERAGVALPQTRWLAPGESCDVAALCRERGWSQAVVKPLISANAFETTLTSQGDITGPRIVQAFVPDLCQHGEWSLLYFSGCYSHAVLKRPAAGDFRVQLDCGGSVAPAAPAASLRVFADSVMRLLPQPATFARVDIVVSAERGPLLMELEVIEPELFLWASHAAPERAARAVLKSLPAAARRVRVSSVVSQE